MGASDDAKWGEDDGEVWEARRVAADMLRQAGDETGARVLERAGQLISKAHCHVPRATLGEVQRDWDLCAYLDPAWAKAEVERARVEAVEMHEAWKTSEAEVETMRRARADWGRRVVATREVSFGVAVNPLVPGDLVVRSTARRAERLRPGELEALADPARLTYSAPVIPVDRTALLSATLETPGRDEDEPVTPPASPPPAR